MAVDHMSVDQMSVGQMVFDEKTWSQSSVGDFPTRKHSKGLTLALLKNIELGCKFLPVKHSSLFGLFISDGEIRRPKAEAHW
jgi:hypothetical protein